MLCEAGCAVATWDHGGTSSAGAVGSADVLHLECDVTDEVSVAAALDATHHRLGQITFLVNAVGLGQYGEPFAEMAFARWRDIVTVNLIGAMQCAHAVVPDMVRAGAGVVVNICSIWSTQVAEGRSAYIASKWGLLGATRALATELTGAGVRVCAVSPGPVDTPMTAAIASDEVRRSWMRPSDIAAGVRFALGPDGAHLVGGELQLYGAVRPYRPPETAAPD
jgi:3-oxoacyl-[acyl-carrier protein] reductase